MASVHLDPGGAGSTDLFFVAGWLAAVHDWDAVRSRLANFATGAYAPEGLSAVPPTNGGFDEANPVVAAAIQDAIVTRAAAVASPDHLAAARSIARFLKGSGGEA
jgi:hypothetical protein